MARLKQDVLFWLRDSEQQVKIALTIHITRRGNITIQQWILDQTASRTSVKPIQAMHITRNRSADSSQHQISGTIHIQLEDCFLRVKIENESDFILSHDDMTEIAEAVWDYLLE
ncbi:hypothetical protein N7449_008778 [Penicillium cf. viridicatum]|uniref:Uncharacterized protein n=1 Tax=Penicillium cf. viridicatum TaxID=2972119 RepID=A0A9W9JB18_9EURO|nr:hypothetical protein N7449_008778 [Penicillium cf. viridicatum]